MSKLVSPEGKILVPGVNDLIGKIGLGSVPKREIPADVSGLLRRDLKN